MVKVSSFQQIMETLENLPPEDQDMIIDLLQKRRIEQRRLEIAKNAELTIQSLVTGTAKKGNIADLKADLLGD